MKVFLDSNVYFNNYFFESAPFRYLSHFINNLGYELLVPRVVVQEVENNRRKAVEKLCGEGANQARQLKMLTQMDITFPEANTVAGYDFLRELQYRFDGVKVLEYDSIPHAEVVRRAIAGTRPFRGGEKGYRDTLIWLSLLQHLKNTTQTTEFVFINDNYTDFYKSEADSSFHDDFKTDLAQMARVLGISTRTLRRQSETPEKPMPADLASKAWMFAELLAKATDIFGGKEEAERWMSRPAMGLDGQRPIDLLQTVQGAELVNDFLTRLEYGVYS